MDLFNFFKFKKKEKEEKYEKILSQRESIKQSLKQTFIQLGFNNEQMQELFVIIDDSQNRIEELKKKLLDNNSGEFQEQIIKEIEEISKQMQVDLKTRTDEILFRIRNIKC